MKKILTVLLMLTLVLSLVACGGEKFDPSAKSEGVMTYADYDAAELDTEVVIEGYVQGMQAYSAEYGNTSLYLQDPDGAYFVYRLACTAEDAAKFVKGAKVKITGYKSAWSGEVEIVDATFEIMEGTWVAEPMDATALLGTDDLIKHQNKLAKFNDLTIEKIEYKNGEPGDDIYVTVSKDGNSYSFCVESSLVGPETDVYKAFADLVAGDVVDIEGFLYWYEGVNTHITAVSK